MRNPIDRSRVQRSWKGLFDLAWYLEQNPELASGSVDPLAHYLDWGWRNGRSPHPLFDAAWYLQTNPDVALAGLEPSEHYQCFGWQERRSPHPFFDAPYYAARYPDVEGNPLTHYLEVGAAEGRDPHPDFDAGWYAAQSGEPEARTNALRHLIASGAKAFPPGQLARFFDAAWYLTLNTDVRAEGLDPLWHYKNHGWKEGRDPHPLFNAEFYAKQTGPIGVEPLDHYLRQGWQEGRAPHWLFDPGYYLANVPDRREANPWVDYLERGGDLTIRPHPFFDPHFYAAETETLPAGANPLLHYLTEGIHEGREPNAWFDSAWYVRHHPEFAFTAWDAVRHYLEKGEAEGREAHAPGRLSKSAPVLALPFELRRAPRVAGKDVCLFVTYSADGEIPDHTRAYLAALKASGCTVVVIVSTDGLSRPLPPEVEAADGLIVRANHGWDFGAWAAALAMLPELWTARTLILTNDSVFGPVTQDLLDGVLDRIRRSQADIVALTDSYQDRRHLMSYFIAFRAQGLSLKAVRDYWAGVSSLKNKRDVVDSYELPNLDAFTRGGATIEVLFPAEPAGPATAANPTLVSWKKLLSQGFPFIKIQALRDKLEFVDRSDWERELPRGNPLIETIGRYLDGGPAPRNPVGSAVPAPRRRFRVPTRLTTTYGATTSVRPTAATDLVLEVPFRFASRPERSPEKVAVFLHVFYPELTAALLAAVRNIPVQADLFVSTDTEAKRSEILAQLRGYSQGKVDVRIFPNRGRDIAPFLVGFRDEVQAYDIILHVHSKLSPHDSRFAQWRDFLLENLIGCAATVASVFALFDLTDVGVVFSDHFPAVRNLLNWGGNFDAAKALLAGAGVELARDLPLEFPSGSFFWARSAALRPFLEAGLTFESFPEEAGQTDGTLAHAIERSILFGAEKAGFSFAKVATSKNTPADRLVPVDTASGLADALKRTYRPLLGNPVRPFSYFDTLSDRQSIATRRETGDRPRLNLLIPTLRPERVFGGVSTALRLFEDLGRELGDAFDLRILVTSQHVDLGSTQSLPAYRVLPPNGLGDGGRCTIVDVCDEESSAELAIRRNDIFLATAWWTAEQGYDYRDTQSRFFGVSHKLVYLIQDFEPGFYPWSDNHQRAEATYRRPHDMLAVINSEELAAFMLARYDFPDAQIVPYAFNPEIGRALVPVPRERIILIYARPGTPRNAWSTIACGIYAWQQSEPVKSRAWRIIGVGEPFTSGERLIPGLEIAGKLSLAEYGALLSRASIGISLMISPHPSYPPLEMALAGLRVITNRFGGKDLSLRSDNIVALDALTEQTLTAALAAEIERAEPRIGTTTGGEPIRGLETATPIYSPATLATIMRGWLGRVGHAS